MRRFVLLLAALIPAPALAQTREDTRAWLNVTAMGAIDDDLLYFAEVQARTRDGVSEHDQLIVRPAIGWRVGDALSLYQGYARVLSNPAEGADRVEHRSFQQASVTAGKVGPGALSFRLRLEQRWMEDVGGTGWRARAMARFSLPLTRSEKGTRLLTYAEPLVALNDTRWGARKGFDQLRSFLGFELPVGGKSTIEAGYLNQLVDRGGGRRDVNHVVSLTAFIRP